MKVELEVGGYIRLYAGSPANAKLDRMLQEVDDGC